MELHRIAKSEDERQCLLSVIPVKTGIQSSVLVFLAVSEIPSMFPRVIPRGGASRDSR